MADDTAINSVHQEVGTVRQGAIAHIDTPAAPSLHESAVAALEQLHRWIGDRRLEDYCRAQLFNAIVLNGWSREAAVGALQRVMGDIMDQREVQALLRGSPGPDRGLLSTMIVKGHEVRVLLEMQNPAVVLFGSVLTNDECDEIMEIARPRMERSRHGFYGEGKPGHVSEGRTSDGANLRRSEDIEVIKRVDERIEALLSWPIDYSEDWQVMRYSAGGHFTPHHDCFGPDASPWHPWLRRGGHRCATLLVYLQTPVRGGGTTFPDVPMEVSAIKGNAVCFGGPRPDAAGRVLHGGSPVIEGEKWAMVKWFRQGPSS